MSIEDAAAIIDAAVAAADPSPITPGGLYVAVVPLGHDVKIVDDRDKNDARADTPRRRKGTARLSRAESFIAYVQANKDPVAPPALYADDDGFTVTAVFNGSGPVLPGWGDDRVVLKMSTTPEWDAWTDRDGAGMSQVQFGEFLEDHKEDVVNPDGATLLEMVTTFEALVNVEVTAVTRLANGTRQLSWKETATAKAGQAGQAEFPDTFLLGIAPFKGLDPVAIGARLRYRVSRDHVLTLTFILDDTDKVVQEAFDVVLAAVEQDTSLIAYHGTPPA